jgi:hypothetical protein
MSDMITTTVRIDRRTWAKVKLHAARNGTSRSGVIRDATMLHVAAMETSDTHLHAQFEPVIADHGQRLGRIEQWIGRQGGEV